VWSGYDRVDDVVSDLTDPISRLAKGDLSRWTDLEILFAPTGDLNEISISNGWSGWFLDLARRFDDLAMRLKERGLR
jgi:hypothetical protein